MTRSSSLTGLNVVCIDDCMATTVMSVKFTGASCTSMWVLYGEVIVQLTIIRGALVIVDQYNVVHV